MGHHLGDHPAGGGQHGRRLEGQAGQVTRVVTGERAAYWVGRRRRVPAVAGDHRRVEVGEVTRIVEHHGRPRREVPVEHVGGQDRRALQHPVDPVEEHRLAVRSGRVHPGELVRHVLPRREAHVGGDPVDRLLGHHPGEERVVVGVDEAGQEDVGAEVGDGGPRGRHPALLHRPHGEDPPGGVVHGQRRRPGVVGVERQHGGGHEDGRRTSGHRAPVVTPPFNSHHVADASPPGCGTGAERTGSVLTGGGGGTARPTATLVETNPTKYRQHPPRAMPRSERASRRGDNGGRQGHRDAIS